MPNISIKELFEGAGFDPAILAELEKTFESRVEARVQEVLEEKVQAAVLTTETSNKALFKEAVELIESKHAAELKKLEDDAITGVAQLVQVHEKQLTDLAITHRNQFETVVSDFLDEALAAAIPTALIEEAAKNKAAMKVLANVRNAVGLDESIITANVRGALNEGATAISKLETELSETKQRLALANSIALLESKVSNLPDRKREHLKGIFAGKSAKFITENYDAAVRSYDKGEQRHKDQISRRTRENSPASPDRPLLNEDVKTGDQSPPTPDAPINESRVTSYLESLKNSGS